MNDTQKYYRDGFIKLNFKNNKSLEEITENLISLYNGNIKDKFELISKYPGTKDLRPNVFDYNEAFLKILFDNQIPQKLFQLTGERLTLAHVQVRKSENEKSYMPWHRDMYFIDDRIVGNIPPGHKIIFYPKLPNTKSAGMQLLKGSHLCLFQKQPADKFVLPGCSYLDQQLFQLLDTFEYKQSKDEFLIFNTSLLHGALPDAKEEGSIRLIYSFVRPFQFDKNFGDQDVHLRLNKIYEDMLKNEEKN